MAASLSTSAGHLLQLLRSGTVTTRRQLREVTDLSRSTISQRVEQLIAAGLVVEQGTELSSGGRPAGILSFDDVTPTMLVADLGATHGRVAVTDAGGRVLAEKVILSSIATGPEAVLTRLCDEFEDLLAKAGRSPETVCGIGIGLPGPVDFDNACVVRPPLMRGWHRFPIRDLIARRFEAPVHVDNDANLMALGEQSACYPDARSLLLVKVGTGIGAGVVVDGTLLRGAQGAEGDIGHVRIPGSSAVCACGATGCLAATASGGAIVRQLSDGGVSVASIADVVSLLEAGNAEAVAAVTSAGQQLGEVLSTVVALMNPDALVIGGDLGVNEHVLRGAHERLLQRTQALATGRLVVATSQLGDRAGVVGAVAMVREQEFNADAVDHRLEAIPSPREASVGPSVIRPKVTHS